MSALVATGTEPMISSVVGESTLSVSFPAGSTHSPPMKNLSYVSMTSPSRHPDRPGAQGTESIGPSAARPIRLPVKSDWF